MKNILPFFTQEESLKYCSDVSGLFSHMDVPKYKPEDWRLFIDGSKRSLKCVILHTGNRYVGISNGHSIVKTTSRKTSNRYCLN